MRNQKEDGLMTEKMKQRLMTENSKWMRSKMKNANKNLLNSSAGKSKIEESRIDEAGKVKS